MNRQIRLEQMKEYQRVKRVERRNYCIKKLGGICVKCGSTKNLEFDHIIPFGDSTGRGNRISELLTCNIERLNEQLEKCQLLCKSCHKEKTNYIDRIHGRMTHGTVKAIRYCTPICDKCRFIRNERVRQYRKKLTNTI